MNLETARVLVESAEAHARSLSVPVVVSVVDEGNNTVIKVRMDDALLVSVEFADDKAYTAVALNMKTESLRGLTAPGADLQGLEHALGGRLVPFGGGIPVHDQAGKLIGAIGVSGGTTEQDIEIAERAVAALPT